MTKCPTLKSLSLLLWKCVYGQSIICFLTLFLVSGKDELQGQILHKQTCLSEYIVHQVILLQTTLQHGWGLPKLQMALQVSALILEFLAVR